MRLGVACAFVTCLSAFASALAQSPPDDPFLWLESVDSPKAMAWVEAHNAVTVKALQADPTYQPLYDQALAIASAKDRIPEPSFTRGAIINFWTDADHLRGLLRETSLASYRTAAPQWTPVLDVDALGRAEHKSWVFHGMDCLQPAERQCLVSLSDGGEDAEEVREFDLARRRFVQDGFFLPHGKQQSAWEDADHLLVAREWEPGQLTQSGYPYVLKRLARGQPLSQAQTLFTGQKSDVSVEFAVQRDAQQRKLVVIYRALDFFRHETWILAPRGVERLAIPLKADVDDVVDGRVIVKLNEAWSVDGADYPAGALVQLDLAAVKADPAHLKPRLIWTPGPRQSLDGEASTRDDLVLSVLDNVRGRVLALRPKADGGWTTRTLAVPDNLSVSLGSADPRSNRAFLTFDGFLTPSTLELADLDTGALKPIKALPAKFDASKDGVEQFEATSSDGTQIPYFVVRPKAMAYDGSTPTLMTAYGGFQVSNTPYYSGVNGKLWLERGGAYVLANIRGGGEFGPAWHEAGIGVKRQIIYDDFAAVARDLIARRITSPRRLGIEGGSNGGLLMGVEFVQHPDLWNAVDIQVPLLDMIRISKIAAGASWQGEYGDVNADPAVMAFWLKTSPYQNLKPGVAYPTPFIFTTTKDDRVGPQHARKFAARMEAMGLPFYYFENTEGGHGFGADLKQSARSTALQMTYMSERLMGDAPPPPAPTAAP